MAATSTPSTQQMARLIKRWLDEGRRVHIERLGTFRPTSDGSFEFLPSNRPKVFLAYAVEDSAKVEELYAALLKAGFDPWMDRRKLLPGQNWPRAIEGAIETADFFIACLSRRSLDKRGTFQSEMRYALDCARTAPFDDIYFIPVRLEECSVPRQIRQQLQYVDVFPDFKAGVQNLLGLIRKEVKRRASR